MISLAAAFMSASRRPTIYTFAPREQCLQLYVRFDESFSVSGFASDLVTSRGEIFGRCFAETGARPRDDHDLAIQANVLPTALPGE